MNTNEKYLVSIITPLYNSEKYVGQAIESVLKQTYKNWEMLIVDDCSTDDSRKVVKKYLADSRIKYFCMEVNSGGATVHKRSAAIDDGDIYACKEKLIY